MPPMRQIPKGMQRVSGYFRPYIFVVFLFGCCSALTCTLDYSCVNHFVTNANRRQWYQSEQYVWRYFSVELRSAI